MSDPTPPDPSDADTGREQPPGDEAERPRRGIDGLIQFGLKPLADDDRAACDKIVSRVQERSANPSSTDGIRLSGSATIPVPSEPAKRYELGVEIGRGGVGQVVSGRDTTLGRKVAVKLLGPEHTTNPQMVRRFIEEAQIGGQLQHPGVVPVHEVGYREDGRPFFAMKLVNGSTFAELLSARRSPDEDRRRYLSIFERVCQTIAFAHARGVVHRDLKPSNIMVGAYGEVQVMDWGLAKVLKRRGPAPEESSTPALTEISTVRTRDANAHSETGSVMGTPAYMPPEQARGEVELIDERADVFALGGLLCQVLTGEPPYTGEYRDVKSRAERGQLDDAYGRIQDLTADDELKALARDCLEPERERRPRHAGVVADRFAAYRTAVDERAQGAALAAARARGRLVAVSVAGLAIITIGALLYRQERSRADRIEQVTADLADGIEDTERRLASARSVPRDPAAWQAVETAARGVQKLTQLTDVLESERRRGQAMSERVLREVEAARGRMAKLAREAEMLKRLERLRATRNPFDQGQTAISYLNAFRDFGLDLDQLSAEAAAERIRESAIADALVRGLDDLYSNGTNGALLEGRRAIANLAEIMILADADPQRRGIRRAIQQRDLKALKQIAVALRDRPASAQTFNLLAQYLAYLGDFKGSIALSRHALSRFPQDYWLNAQLANNLLMSAGDPAEALKFFEIARAVRPDRASPRVRIASLLSARGDTGGAEAEIRRALAVDDEWPSAHYELGVILLRQGHYEDGLESMRRALALSPDEPHFHYRVGMVLVGAGDPEAEAMFSRVVELVPNHLPALRQLGRLRAKSGDRAGAVQAYRALIRIGLPVEKRGSPADDVHRRFGYDIRDSLVRAYAYLADDHARGGRIPEAIAAYREAWSRCATRDPRPGERLARLLMDIGRVGDAATIAGALLETYPQRPSAFTIYAETLCRQGEFEKAEQMHELGKSEAVRLGQSYPANLIALTARRVRDARALDARAKEAAWPTRAEPLAGFAAVLAERRRYAEAVDMWKRALADESAHRSDAHGDRCQSAAIAAGFAAAGVNDQARRNAFLALAAEWLASAIDRTLRRAAVSDEVASTAAGRFAIWKHHVALEALRPDRIRQLPAEARRLLRDAWSRVARFRPPSAR